MSPRLREEKRLREQRILGIKTGIPTYQPAELTIKGFKILVYDVSQTKVGELGADIQFGKVSEIEWELMDFGCGAFSFILDSLPPFPITYRTRVDVHPYFDTTPWFSGFIQTIPKAGQKPPYRYIGFGFFEQLDWVVVTGSYASQEISVILKDIIENTVAPNTQIAYNASKIEATSYTVTDISFDHTRAKDAIQQLANLVEGYEFGVDNSREFYFRAEDTNVNYSYWAGGHFQDVLIEEDPLAVRNKLYVKAGQIQTDGTNIVGNVLDQGSIDTYGLREDVVTAPDILNGADALAWAAQILTDKKNPKIKAKIVNVFLDQTKTKIEAAGKIRITAHEGTAYELPIDRVLYRISKDGILAELDCEQNPHPLEEILTEEIKASDDERRLQDKRTKELYTDLGNVDAVKLNGHPGSYYAIAGHTHGILSATVSWDPPSLATGASATKIVTVTGAVFGDFVSVSMDATLRGFILTGYVNAADSVTIVLANVGAATYNFGTQNFYIRVWPKTWV